MLTNTQSRTNSHEIANGIYRINTPISIPGGPEQFSFNQDLIVDDEPLLFHTGPRQLFPFVQEAISSVLPLQALRYVGLSHFEADECGSLNAFIATCPHAVPFCSRIAALTSVNDFADRPPRTLADSEELSLGHHTVRVRHAPRPARVGVWVNDGVEHSNVLVR